MAKNGRYPLIKGVICRFWCRQFVGRGEKIENGQKGIIVQIRLEIRRKKPGITMEERDFDPAFSPRSPFFRLKAAKKADRKQRDI